MVQQVSASKRAVGNMLLVHAVDAQTQQALGDQGVTLASAAILMRDTEVMHALRDAKAERGAALPEGVLAALPTLLVDAAPYLDTVDTALVYAIELPGRVGKVVVRINYSEKGRIAGERVRMPANFVQTGGIVDEFNLQAPRYVALKK